jgi:hypothetical protein
LILGAREAEPEAGPVLTALAPTPFRSQLPPARLPAFMTLDAATLGRITGSYELAPGAILRVFDFDGRPFINVPGRGEAEMFAVSPLEFVIRVEAGVRVRFEVDAGGAVTAVALSQGAEEMRALRRLGR